MHPRQLGIIVIAAVAAFGVAFGVGKATSSKASPSAGGSVKALDVADAPSVGTVTTGAVPGLKAIRAKKPRKPKDKAPDAGPGPETVDPSPRVTPAPKRNPAPNPTAKPKPKPTPPPDEGGGETPRTGGGED